MRELKKEYFNWLCRLVRISDEYSKLMTRLHEIPFTYTIPMDANRESDGIDLRYRFGYENHISQPEIAAELDIRPCSVLEMMTALSLRISENIMDGPNQDRNPGTWFGLMLRNLHLGYMGDRRFAKSEVDERIQIFLERKYRADGSDGLFTIPRCPKDMRTMEIWQQAMWWLDYIE